MNKQKLITKVFGAVMATTLMLGSVCTVYAISDFQGEGSAGSNIATQTIPVKASIDSYYEVVVPAGLDSDGAIDMTRDNNDYVKMPGDAQGTFYGYTYVGVRGVLKNGKKVVTTMKCANLVEAATPTLTAAVDLTNLSSTEATKIGNIWSATEASVKETNAVTFGSIGTAGTTGISQTFDTLSTSETTKKYVLLHTNLVKDGSYTSNLVIDFSLK